jgi:hypothetical protein
LHADNKLENDLSGKELNSNPTLICLWTNRNTIVNRAENIEFEEKKSKISFTLRLCAVMLSTTD